MPLALGLMSGTSADGVSLVLCHFQNRKFKLIHYQTFAYPENLRAQILKAQSLRTPELSRLNFSLGDFFAACTLRFLKKTRTAPSKITVIGSHGQTVYHGPGDLPPNTLQIGEAAILRARTDIPVVSDFRPSDIAAGGQGAPLIPFFDDYFFGGGPVRALQNIGGIANVTVVGKSISPIAFDTGPGNCLMDIAVQKISRGKSSYDAGGKLASRGTIHEKAVRQMLAHSYFKKNPPKSTGRELFNEAFIPRYLWKSKPSDILATLTYFTAATIYHSHRNFVPVKPREMIVSGGGALNRTLMNYLRDLFLPVKVKSIGDWDIHVQAKEPMAFAFFALRALTGKINHLPRTTGARKAVILGKITP
ncbi:MAG: anhydro-N-acetylmuramic acid kinase [Candidatus Omnitrophica bacterium]|nr:anhydro-N-acetylmuramic acid kinase [Candidatus Omnitrophota bacterium]